MSAIAQVDRTSLKTIGPDLRKNSVKHRGIKIQATTSLCKMKIDIQKLVEGVTVAKCRYGNHLEHLRKTKDQSAASIVKTMVTNFLGSIEAHI